MELLNGIRCSLLAAAFVAPSVVMAADLTVVTDGGSVHDALTKASIEPIEKLLGIDINVEGTGNKYTQLKAQIAAGQVLWDVVELGSEECILGTKEGLFETLDPNVLTNLRDVPDSLRQPTWVSHIAYSYILVWNKAKYADNPPQSWADFWDVEKFPGRRALRSNAYFNLEVALMADGVARDQVYPMDVERAYQKLEVIKPHITTWWESGAQSVQLVTDGEVDILSMYNGRMDTAMKDGVDLAYTFNESVMARTCLVVPKGSSNTELALKVLNEIMDPTRQADFAKMIPYGPANAKAFEDGRIPDDIAMALPSYPENLARAVVVSDDWWIRDEAVQALEEWLRFLQR